jgi:hypothetical protein
MIAKCISGKCKGLPWSFRERGVGGASVHKDPCGGLYHKVYCVVIFSRSYIVAGWLVASWRFLYSILLSSKHSREASKATGIIGGMEKEFLTHSRLQQPNPIQSAVRLCSANIAFMKSSSSNLEEAIYQCQLSSCHPVHFPTGEEQSMASKIY